MDIARVSSRRPGFEPEPIASDRVVDANNSSWDEKTKKIVVRAKNVPQRNTKTLHDYTVSLTVEDITTLISILGTAGSADDASLLRVHLAGQVPALARLLACATGQPVPMADAGSEQKDKLG